MEVTEIIRRGIITERTVALQNVPAKQANRKEEAEHTHCYVFEVALAANKVQIRQAIEKLFDVTVLKVNTMRMPGKTKTIRTRTGTRVRDARPWKKAIVTVRASETIAELQP